MSALRHPSRARVAAAEPREQGPQRLPPAALPVCSSSSPLVLPSCPLEHLSLYIITSYLIVSWGLDIDIFFPGWCRFIPLPSVLVPDGRDQDAVRESFSEDAFLVGEETREQLLSHLLALTTVDFSSFSIHYPSVTITYRVSIITAK